MRTVEPSSSCTRAEPWICANRRSVWLLSQHDFQPALLDRAILDLRAIVIGHELAAADLAIDRALVRQIGRGLVKALHEQVRGTPVDRDVEDLVRLPRSLDDGLVIAGDEAVALAEPRYFQRREILLEEGARLGAVGNLGRPRDATGIAQGRAERARIRRHRRRILRRDRLAAGAKGLEGGEMIVLAPAGNVGPGERKILAAVDRERQLELRIGKRALVDDRRLEAKRCGESGRCARPDRQAGSATARLR